MKKRLLFFIPVICLSISLAQAGQDRSKNKTELISSTADETVIKVSVDGFDKIPVSTPWGQQFIIHADNTTPLLKKGSPDLPKVTVSVAIPDLGRMEVEIISSVYTDHLNIEIAPSKGSIFRNVDRSLIPFTKNASYTQNNFFPGALADLQAPYIMRDVRGQAVWVQPFQYNPVTKTLRVYSEIVLRVYKAGDDGVNPLVRFSQETTSQEFSKIYENHFINGKSGNSILYTPLAEYGNMLIICHGPFMTAMQPFIDWKTKIGIPVTMVDVASIGNNATAIKAYVQNYYNTNGLTYLLIVGDAAQVATMYFPASGDSDNGYSYLAGNDRYPDALVGRFSCETVTHVNTMVNRVIRYEKFPAAGPSWYENGMGIASDQGPGDDNEMDYEHMRNIRTQLMGYTYAGVEELYDGSQGGMDASGNPTPSMVANVVNAGVGIINYTGHGSSNSWVSSGFSSTNVSSLTNVDKYPFIYSVACVNGEFNGQTCFAETWLRAAQGMNPTGAIGCQMSTINQYWDEPMEGMDQMISILTETYSNNIKRTFTGIAANGMMGMNDAYGTSGMDMTDTWLTFGDPSIFVRTDVQSLLTANHVPTEVLGVSNLVVNSNTDGARVALTLNGALIGTGIIASGTVNITFPPVNIQDTIYVTVTAYNKVPYFGIVEVLPLVSTPDPGTGSFELTLSPNPANDHLNIGFSTTQAGVVNVQLFDAVGKKVMSIASGNYPAGIYSEKVTVGNLQAGIYFVHLRSGKQTITRKLVLTH